LRTRKRKIVLNRESLGLASAQRSRSVVGKMSPLLGQISELAVGAGLSVDDVVHLLQLAFVNAAQAHSRLRNGRPNISQTAAATGMTRPQVAKSIAILGKHRAGKSIEVRSNSRTLRVVRAWHSRIRRTDHKSLWTLPYAGKRSFSEIVRRSAGDVPPRAMLQELRRLGWVHHDERTRYVALLLNFDGSTRDSLLN
jgi:hypothetical protein